MDWRKKFTERKFWMAVVGGILLILQDGLGLHLDTATILAFAGLIATWIFKEADLDKARLNTELQKFYHAAEIAARLAETKKEEGTVYEG